MTRTWLTWLLVLGLSFSGAARAQVHSGGDPAGATLTPFTATNPAQPQPVIFANGELRACTSGPDYMLIASYRYEGIVAVGASSYEGAAYEVPILHMWDLAQDPLFDEDDEVTALAATPLRDAVYAAITPIYQSASCLPILRVDFHGNWSVAVGCEEISAFGTGRNRVTNLATAADGTLYAVVWYQDEKVEVTLRIDPDGEPMKRAEQVLSSETILTPSPDLSDYVRIRQIAALPEGALAAVVEIAVIHENWEETGWVLLRRDADGTLTELTARELTSDLSGVDVEADLPAMSCRRGMMYDQADMYLVCGGNGKVFLIDPFTPMRNHLMINSQWVMNTYSAWSGEPAYSTLAGSTGPGGCLGDVSWGSNRAYGTFMGTFMLVSWDTAFLDLDNDRALGFEEAARGTDPFVADSDGGGTCDGLEFVGWTDPQAPADDRAADEPAMEWVSPGLWFGSHAGNSTGSRHGLERFGIAAPDGSLLLLQKSSGDKLVRFTGWDHPLEPTEQTGHWYGLMAAGPDGMVYRAVEGGGIVASHPDGTDQVIIEEAAVRDLTGADTIQVVDLIVQPNGVVVFGTHDGHLIAVSREGEGEVLYDAFADYAEAGLWTEETGCFGLNCALPIGPIAYEPVHGMLLFWIKTDFVGSASYGFMLDLVAILPGGHMRIVADHWAFAEYMGQLGGLEPLDMEPDMAGGLWVLGSGNGSRRVLHLDGQCLNPVTGLAMPSPMQPPFTDGLTLISAYDLMVTPQGRFFAIDAHFSNTSGLVSEGLG